MSELIQELGQYGDMLVFDSPPTLAVTDAAVLARQMDGVLLVVESAKTREVAAKRAAQGLLKVNANVLGIAVNRISYRLAGSHYYYYDYYENKGDNDGSRPDGSQSKKGRSRKDRPADAASQPVAAGSFSASQLRLPPTPVGGQPGSSAQDA
jgi:Mrp family chromosome partitioning ATPase